MTTVAHEVGAVTPAMPERGVTEPDNGRDPEPDITRDLAERVDLIVESGELSTADAAAIRAALDCARRHPDDAPSFF